MNICMLVQRRIENDARVRREAGALAAAGHRVTVIEGSPSTARTRDEVRFELRSVTPSRLEDRVPRPVRHALAALRAAARGRTVPADVVHAHDVAVLLPAYLLARARGARLVYDTHELATGVPYRNRAMQSTVRLLERALVPRCDAVVTVSEGIADRLQELYRLPTRPAVIRNVTALDAPAAPISLRALREQVATPERHIVLHHGSAGEGRGGRVLIDAMRNVPDAALVFLGEGSPRTARELRAHAEDAGVAQRVHVLDPVPLDELLAHAAGADIGISLLDESCENHRLALPNKVFEYVAAGLPVVVTRSTELSRLLRHYGIGWTVDPTDPEDVARAIREALGKRTDPVLQSNLHRAAADLSWGQEQGRLLDVYARLPRVAS